MIAHDSGPAGSGESAGSEGGGERSTAVEAALRNGRRRDVLAYLSANGGEVDLSSLALYLAADGDETLSAIIEALHDCHLPKLAAHDLLSYEDGSRVRLLIEPGHAEALVSRAEDESD